MSGCLGILSAIRQVVYQVQAFYLHQHHELACGFSTLNSGTTLGIQIAEATVQLQ